MCSLSSRGVRATPLWPAPTPIIIHTRAMSTPMRWGPPPRGGRGGGGSYHVLGVYIPRPVAWLILIVLAMSAGGSLLDRMGIPLVRSSWLSVDQVWQGEVWRVVTWAPL